MPNSPITRVLTGPEGVFGPGVQLSTDEVGVSTGLVSESRQDLRTGYRWTGTIGERWCGL